MDDDRMSPMNDLSELQKEIDQFKKEKERVRTIVGQIGGIPVVSVKILNTIFFIVIIVCFVISLVTKGHLSILMIDIGLMALAIKLIVLMHYMSKVNHFQLWILTSMEWRINEMNKRMRKVAKKLDIEE